ncbi:MAG: peptidase M19, partial [Albidovulum sp.]
MRKWVLMLLGLLGLASFGFFGFAPGYLEASMNKIDGQPLIEVSPEAEALHKSLLVVDLHSDTLMWKRDPLR